jgi:DNA-binding transcriptional ArsR family regulator
VSADPVDATFAALADPTRRRVVGLLADREGLTPSELARELPVTRQAISKHLALLSEAGLVSAIRAGRETRYRLTPAPLEDAVAWMAGVGSQWDSRLARLERYVRRAPPDG